MSQAQTGQASAPASTAQPSGVVSLKVRITGARRITTKNGKLWLTLCKLPAPDEFSAPQTLELRSTERLGAEGEDWQGKCRIGGYPRSYPVVDAETGEKTTVYTAEVNLTVIE